MRSTTAVALACVALATGAVALSDFGSRQVNSIEAIEGVNQLGTSWRAGHNARWEGLTLDSVSILCGALDTPDDARLPIKKVDVNVMGLPMAYDVRTKWGGRCPSVKAIRDQGGCGSCWAVSAAETMTDRTCMHSNGTMATGNGTDVYLSAEDILACCEGCGNGCRGGFPSAAQQYWVNQGVVSGGPYNSHQNCLDYTVAPCEHHVAGPRPKCVEQQFTPQCVQQCQNGESWSQAKHYGAQAYGVNADVESIQQEIMTNGPVQAAYSVYADFPTYKSGVYRRTSNQFLGGHAVKIIGWGNSEDGTPFWTVANSWGTDWGNQGFFNILRGSDECGIESQIVAGMPSHN